MILELALAVILGSWQTVERNDQPLASATDPAYLSCYVWNGHRWSKPAPRSARTPTLESPKGFRAYAEVVATFTGASCENTTRLYVSSGAGQSFKVVYTKGPSDSGGNGIRLISWSPNGDKLLAQINTWEYETDLGYGRLGLIYDAVAGSAHELEELNAALSVHFGKACEFDVSLQRWTTEQKLTIKIFKTPETEEYEQHFCVTEPRLLLFDLRKRSIDTAR
jgi:hypothetical protein